MTGATATETAEHRIARSGRLSEVRVSRWGTDRRHEGEFFRAEITGAVFS
jgi:hypothetical protein